MTWARQATGGRASAHRAFGSRATDGRDAVIRVQLPRSCDPLDGGGPLGDGSDLKVDLLRYLQMGREARLWKLEGLSEYDIRRPMVRTGTDLLGLVKHVATMDAGYLGAVFDRPFAEPFRMDGRGCGTERGQRLERVARVAVGVDR